jgi:hypothetical protein
MVMHGLTLILLKHMSSLMVYMLKQLVEAWDQLVLQVDKALWLFLHHGG